MKNRGQEAHPLWKMLFEQREMIKYKFIFDGKSRPYINIYTIDGIFVGGLIFDEDEFPDLIKWADNVRKNMVNKRSNEPHS